MSSVPMNLNKDWQKECKFMQRAECVCVCVCGSNVHICVVLCKLNCINRKQKKNKTKTKTKIVCGTVMCWGFVSSTKCHINAAHSWACTYIYMWHLCSSQTMVNSMTSKLFTMIQITAGEPITWIGNANTFKHQTVYQHTD